MTAIRTVADLMSLAARTAPKAAGKDHVVIEVLEGDILNRLAEGKLPICAEMCATKALLGGDGDTVAEIFRQRVAYRGAAGLGAGWGVAYRKRMRARVGPEGKAAGQDE